MDSHCPRSVEQCPYEGTDDDMDNRSGVGDQPHTAPVILIFYGDWPRAGLTIQDNLIVILLDDQLGILHFGLYQTFYPVDIVLIHGDAFIWGEDAGGRLIGSGGSDPAGAKTSVCKYH